MDARVARAAWVSHPLSLPLAAPFLRFRHVSPAPQGDEAGRASQPGMAGDWTARDRHLDGAIVNEREPKDRDIAMVFQDRRVKEPLRLSASTP